MSKVHTQEQTTIKAVTIELSPDEARKLRSKLGNTPSIEQQLNQAFGYGQLGGFVQQNPRDGLDDLRAQLKAALEGKN